MTALVRIPLLSPLHRARRAAHRAGRGAITGCRWDRRSGSPRRGAGSRATVDESANRTLRRWLHSGGWRAVIGSLAGGSSGEADVRTKWRVWVPGGRPRQRLLGLDEAQPALFISRWVP